MTSVDAMLIPLSAGRVPDLQPARLLIADDHAVVRAGYRRLLEAEPGFDVVCEAADGDEAYAAVCAGLALEAAVIDLSMPGRSGLDLLRRLSLRRPGLALMVFTMHVTPALVTQAFQAGAWGYVSKSCAPDELLAALRRVLAGERGVCSSDVAPFLARAAGEGVGALSPREFDVLRLWAGGADNNSIAQRLCLSRKTVANLASSLRSKLGANGAVDLLRRARELGLTVD